VVLGSGMVVAVDGWARVRALCLLGFVIPGSTFSRSRGRVGPRPDPTARSTVVAASDEAESASYLLGRVPLWPMLCLPWQRRLSPLNLG
jgi:hypothetical protein